MAKEVWAEDTAADGKAQHQQEMVFPIGAPNDGFAQYFVGQSYLHPLSTSQVGVYNVTFEPGCRNNWHIHNADQGGGQILVCVAAGAITRSGARRPGSCTPATWSTSPRGSSTGTGPPWTAGSPIWPWRSPA